MPKGNKNSYASKVMRKHRGNMKASMDAHGETPKERSKVHGLRAGPVQMTIDGIRRMVGGTPEQAVNRTNKENKKK